MNAKKKILSLGLAASLAAVAVVGSSLAYFTSEDNAKNDYTVGNVTIDLTEPAWDNGGKEEAQDMYPGEAVGKDPRVTNNGANPAFVRIKVDAPELISFRHGNYEAGMDLDNWTEYEGYYYYTQKNAEGKVVGNIVDPTETTYPLFNQMVLSTEATEATEGGSVDVSAQAVQAQGAKPSYADVENMTVEEIADWFATCGM